MCRVHFIVHHTNARFNVVTVSTRIVCCTVSQRGTSAEALAAKVRWKNDDVRWLLPACGRRSDAADGLQAKIRCVYDAVDMGSSRRHANAERPAPLLRWSLHGSDRRRDHALTRTSKSDIIRSYDGRHGLRQAPEGGRRMDGTGPTSAASGLFRLEEHASCTP